MKSRDLKKYFSLSSEREREMHLQENREIAIIERLERSVRVVSVSAQAADREGSQWNYCSLDEPCDALFINAYGIK